MQTHETFLSCKGVSVLYGMQHMNDALYSISMDELD
jgi:hypothetical protein